MWDELSRGLRTAPRFNVFLLLIFNLFIWGLFIIYPCYQTYSWQQFQKQATSGTGTITRIRNVINPETGKPYRHYLTIKYLPPDSASPILFESRWGVISLSSKVEDSIPIYYAPHDPRRIETKKAVDTHAQLDLPILFLSLCYIFCIYAGSVWILTSHGKQQKRLVPLATSLFHE